MGHPHGSWRHSEASCQARSRAGTNDASAAKGLGATPTSSLVSSLAPSGAACSQLPAITARSMSLQGHGHGSRCSRLTRDPSWLPDLPLPCMPWPPCCAMAPIPCHSQPALTWSPCHLDPDVVTPGTSIPTKSWQRTGMRLLLCTVSAGDEASLPGQEPSAWADFGDHGGEFSIKHLDGAEGMLPGEGRVRRACPHCSRVTGK